MSEGANGPPTNIEAMFVQLASGLTSDDYSVTLHGITHATLFLADRPAHIAGHVSSQKFVSQWGEGENSFAADPPNAVVTFLESEDTPEDATLARRDPRPAGDSITYSRRRVGGGAVGQGGAVLALH